MAKTEDCRVVNSSSELAVCFAHLDGVARVVWRGNPRGRRHSISEVRTTAPSDFITGAACMGSYILATRDLVTNDIEAQVEAALLDGMVCLTLLRQDSARSFDGRRAAQHIRRCW